MTWWLLALLVSFANCFTLDLNKKFKVDGIRGRAWMSFFAFSMLTPFTIFLDFPDHPHFYIAAVCAGLLMSFIGTGLLDLSRIYGGPMTSLTRPFQILSSFLIWALIDPYTTLLILQNPWALGGVALAFTLAGLGQVNMARGSFDMKAPVRMLLLLGLLAGIMSPLTKYGMSFTQEFSQAYVWSWMVHLVSSIFCLGRHFIRPERGPFVTAHFIKCGFILGSLKVLIGPLVSTTYHLSPNPAFASLILMLSTVWLMIIYRIKKHQSYIEIKTALLLLLSAVILILTTKGI